MNGSKSRTALLEFLDYLARKGLMNKTTVGARKAAVNNVLGILDDDEADDVSKIDLDDVMLRFHNIHGSKYTPDSLSAYKSRVKTAVEDFLNYIQNPMAFRPNGQNSTRKAAEKQRGKEDNRPALNDFKEKNTRSLAESSPAPFGTPTILPIPLRADLTVYIQGLPYNLTIAEASKVANVVRAMATEE